MLPTSSVVPLTFSCRLLFADNIDNGLQFLILSAVVLLLETIWDNSKHLLWILWSPVVFTTIVGHTISCLVEYIY